MIIRLIARVFSIVLLFIEMAISLRFVFKLLNVNSDNIIVNAVYEVSDVFVAPFTGIIEGNWEIGRFYIDVDALVALIVYMILAFVTLEIMKVFTPRPEE